MTLPTASTLTDEQLRVMCAEARGWTNIITSPGMACHPSVKWPRGHNKQEGDGLHEIPNPLHDANAAKGLLETTSLNIEIYFDQTLVLWTVRLTQRFMGSKSFEAQEPDFCRAIVLASLRAEGKIL